MGTPVGAAGFWARRRDPASRGGGGAAAGRTNYAVGASVRVAAANDGAMTTARPGSLETLLDTGLHTAASTPTTLRAELGPRTTVVVFLRHFG